MEICELQSAFRGCIQSLELFARRTIRDPLVFLDECVDPVEDIMGHYLVQLGGFKLQLCLKAKMKKQDGSKIEVHFNSSQMVVLPSTDFDQVLEDATEQILDKIDQFQQKGSGWVVRKVLHLDVHISQYLPLRGSSYIALPKYIQDKKAVINVKNKDNQCFKWAVLAGLHPAKDNVCTLPLQTLRTRAELWKTDAANEDH